MLYRLFRIAGKGIEYLSRLEVYISAVLSVVLVFYVLYGAVARYVFRMSAWGIIETPGFIFLGMITLAISYTLMRGRHVAIDAFVVLLSPKVERLVAIVAMFLLLCYSSFALWAGWQTLIWSIQEGLYSKVTGMPLSFVTWLIPVGLFTFCLQAIVELGRLLVAKQDAKKAAVEERLQ